MCWYQNFLNEQKQEIKKRIRLPLTYSDVLIYFVIVTVVRG